MKKSTLFIFSFGIFAFCLNCNLANASVFEPQWSEFCPPNYQNAVFRKGDKPGQYSENNYWAVRRVQFEKAKKECRSYEDSATMNACYQRVVDIERNKSVQRKASNAEKYYKEDRAVREQWFY